jgi:multiple sugar transport system ATP-binding protein
MARVVLDHLAKIYSDKQGRAISAVADVNLAVADGEFMVLVGPSGCGKSTTLRMIAGLESVSAGTITIDERVVNAVAPKDRDIAMVFQNYALYPHMTVYENLAFGLRRRSFPAREIDARVNEAAAMLGLGALLDRRPKALSGGQRQRVAVGRAIVRKPKVFLFDEPLSNLDAKMRATTRTEISRLHARLGATMIYVTHDQVEAMTMGDRICVMKDGRIMQVAEPLALYHRPANLFVAGFIGSPPMNFFRGAIRRIADALQFVVGEPTSPALVIGLPSGLARSAETHVDRPVVFGIRPENIMPADGTTTGGERLPGIDAVLDVIEPMGAETFLYLTTSIGPLVARVHPSARYKAEDRVRVIFDLAAAHLFDATTEESLVP